MVAIASRPMPLLWRIEVSGVKRVGLGDRRGESRGALISMHGYSRSNATKLGLCMN
jgi:hypothetical protein